MERGLFSPTEIDMVMEHYVNAPTSLLAQRLGVPISRVYRLASILDLRKSDECKREMTRQASIRMHKAAGRVWTAKEKKLLKKVYANTPGPELVKLIGRPLDTIYRTANKLGLKKSPECISDIFSRKMMDPAHPARKYWIPKGNVAANKGKRMPGYAPGRMATTQFKKGQTGHNVMPIGATRLADGYLYRKVSEIRYVPWTRNWKQEHYLRWEKKHGPIPAGRVLVFKDGDRTNIRLSNLQLITREDLMSRNTIHHLPEELKELIRLNASIRRHITWRKKNAQKQDV